jgi:TonB family protein
VGVTFDIDPNGKPFNIRVSTPSKYNDLDRTAIKHIQERKYAPSESGIPGETIFIVFDLTD